MTNKKQPIVVMWFRRDLRINDNTALEAALSSGLPVLPLFIFDPGILNRLENKSDRRVNFILARLHLMQNELLKAGGGLLCMHEIPLKAFKTLLKDNKIKAVYTNEDYEPEAVTRDLAVGEYLATKGIPLHLCKDQVIYSPGEVMKRDGTPYTIYTPFKNVWLTKFYEQGIPVPNRELPELKLVRQTTKIPSAEDIGFESAVHGVPDLDISKRVVDSYEKNRNFPAVSATSNLSVHLRFGTVSVRDVIRSLPLPTGLPLLSELIWREFFMHILWHYPHVAGKCFKPAYERIEWRNNEIEFERWCAGKTGYPLVDAGMRELAATGLMHNRVRMVTASFLCKHLLIDWRWGEAWFASNLLDYEQSSNNGNWQWASGTGCDAAPYFRIFNPSEQARKFDPEGEYIRRWIPEFDSLSYPAPIVNHESAVARAKAAYAKALGR